MLFEDKIKKSLFGARERLAKFYFSSPFFFTITLRAIINVSTLKMEPPIFLSCPYSTKRKKTQSSIKKFLATRKIKIHLPKVHE